MFDLIPFRRRGRREIMDLRDSIDSFVSGIFEDLGMMGTAFKADVKETDNEYIIQAELPGFSKENINVELVDNYLTIEASNDEILEEERDNYLRRERRRGSYRRSFYIDNVNEDEIQARYNNGILEIKLPKKSPGKKKKRIIDID
ncbi:Hsp20/alpha crystallin family protein [Halothermothrix orenii]|uniref:Heat shock protein Hsp20 n=1 Tax=Halothermothrix orenii (strain H 168 / OCM 544 / DSM 9562) TaxID=373903 RepID=B8CZF2_HALOH|nr:Hsp20/alpha crystallin family protein [Halothermothrix orenii]ACL70671.1 heat shock protein Hsp20 [Halothermothrix orenii H 168]